MSYIQEYKDNLEKCLDDNTEKIGKCDNECHKNFFKHHWSMLHCSDECSKALKNSGCVEVGIKHDCHRWCERNYHQDYYQKLCKGDCNIEYIFFGDTKDTSEDIGDDFYILADSVSVL